MPLYQMLMLVLASSGVLLIALHFAFKSPAMRERRIREEPERKLKGTEFVRITMTSMVLSLATIFGVVFGLGQHLFYEQAPSFARGALELVLVLMLYDFLYYLTHRYAFHVWKPLRAVHAIHHKARFPTAIDSLYLHPIENLIGLVLLFVCTFVVGPVSIYSFTAIFVIYSHLNILLHCGLVLPFAAPLNYMHKKHDTHHVSMKGGNYASITPVFDLLFRTAE